MGERLKRFLSLQIRHNLLLHVEEKILRVIFLPFLAPDFKDNLFSILRSRFWSVFSLLFYSFLPYFSDFSNFRGTETV